MTKTYNSPFVSVIVPFYNSEKFLPNLLNALSHQTYPVECHEILLVDDCSTDNSHKYISAAKVLFSNPPIVLKQPTRCGSYHARNQGILAARGEILAFTDADCTPIQSWIEAGVKSILENNADLVGGNVIFTYASQRPSAAEILDSRSNMQMEMDILNRGVTKTANLFVTRKVIDGIGLFPSHVKSGGDVIWTGTAVRSGYKLVYESTAIVRHPARSWLELFNKQYRVGKGQIPILRDKGLTWLEIAKDSLSMRKRGGISNTTPTVHDNIPQRALLIFAALTWSRGATLLGRLHWLLKNALLSHLTRK